MGCSSLPHKEYALAQSALIAAKKAEAQKFSAKHYSKALSLYQKGASLYKQKSYEEAKNFFLESLKEAEKAEFKARRKQKTLE